MSEGQSVQQSALQKVAAQMEAKRQSAINTDVAHVGELPYEERREVIEALRREVQKERPGAIVLGGVVQTIDGWSVDLGDKLYIAG